MGTEDFVTLQAIEEAAERIAPYVHETPILRSRQLDERFGCTLLLKCEHLQRAGAFKARGAHNAVMQLDDETAAKGVTTHSSGNHAAALALAARNRGITAYVVMPENSPQVKKDAVAQYGAEIIYCESTLEARETMLANVRERTGAHFVHPYEDSRVACGQGTVGLEIARQCPDDPPDFVIAPVGGGGLLAGVAVAIAARLPQCETLAAEPAGADDAFRSFRDRVWQPQLAPLTIADGLRTSLGKPNFEVILRHVRGILKASDDGIVQAMELLWTRTKQVVEPSAAVTLAVVAANPERFRGKRIALILSGGNVDLAGFDWLPGRPER